MTHEQTQQQRQAQRSQREAIRPAPAANAFVSSPPAASASTRT